MMVLILVVLLIVVVVTAVIIFLVHRLSVCCMVLFLCGLLLDIGFITQLTFHH